MGGNALKHLGVCRLSTSDMLNASNTAKLALAPLLAQLGPQFRAELVPSYRSKSDHGDADMVVPAELRALASNRELATTLGQAFGTSELPFVANGSVVSFAVPAGDERLFQLDLLFAGQSSFDFSLSYFSWNDLGNLMGRVAHGMGLKFGHDGLWLPLRDGDYLFSELLVTADFGQAVEFLGFSHERWLAGFDTREDLYAFVASGRRFTADLFPLEHRSHKARVRDAKRPTYTGFLSWLAERPELPSFSRFLLSDSMESELVAAFPSVKAQLEQARSDLANAKAFKARFNGGLVAAATGLGGAELGRLMARVREHFGSEQALRDFVLAGGDAVAKAVALANAGLEG